MTEMQKRFSELAERSFERGYNVYSDFLGIAEISELKTMHMRVPVALWGGWDGAERAVACFGERDYFADNDDYPVKCILIEPVSQKFADTLTHRDFLGSLMGLGIRREMLGDIVISENCGYLFCLQSVCEYITENLKQVRHTTVTCRITDSIPDNAVPIPTDEEHIVSSRRLDVLISAVYSLSRSRAQELFEKERVFVNGVMKISSSFVPNEGDKISVRGFGRFIFGGELRRTKKDRLVVKIGVYK
ncbi:MAG: hypothetical protein J1F23_00420 [Oscillospiraceae bacterium]|nr:hypothetical protein [Oscillospiraceae bacterium]